MYLQSLHEPDVAMITVVLADDHAVVAEGLASLLKENFRLLGIVQDGRALVAASEELHPDVIVTDISMPLLNGMDAIRQIKAKRPQAKIIVLTMHAEPDLAVQAFRAGASGYLLKNSAGEELASAIREVAAGRSYLTPLIAKDMISVLLEAKGDSSAAGARLTPRQREVLQLVAEGRTMKEVAEVLHISRRTAESHKYETMQMLGAKTTAELIQHAIRMKLVSVE
jgi:DNA-binding NarL/FixJ family response regulator